MPLMEVEKCAILFYLIVGVLRGLDGKYFLCKNLRSIISSQFCDRITDCDDGSDESYGCTPYYCGQGKFTCTNGLCLPISARCDGTPDCSSGSDEMECEHVLSLKNCALQEGKYLCKDNLRCISLTEVCKGTKTNACIDGSEENTNCYGPTDTCDSSCPHPCWRSPDGPVCLCNATDTSQQSLCNSWVPAKVEDCDSVVDKGEQRCVKFDGAIQRSCNEGYTQHGGSDGSCVSEAPYENVLLYSHQQNIVGYDMSNRRKVFIQNDKNVTSISAAHNYIYWSTFSNNVSKIFKTKMLSQRREAKTIYSNSRKNSVITCIAVDWISNNIFFTSQTTLSVCNDNGSACAQLKYSTYGIECVALLPRKGLMFWIENTENKYSGARILKSSMDGSDEQVLVDKNLLFSNNLVVDESSERLYWMDGESVKIESIKYNGKQRKIVVPKAWSTAFFTVFEGILYHAVKSDNGIFVGMNGDAWLKGDSNIKKIHIFNSFLQKTKITNPCVLADCLGLCLLRPTSPPPGLNFTCLYQHPETTIDYSKISSPRYEHFETTIDYEHFETTIDNRDVSKPSTGSTTVRGWSSNTTILPINRKNHLQIVTEKDTRIVSEKYDHRIPEQRQSTCENNSIVTILVILVVTLILSLCVTTISFFYYVSSNAKKPHPIIDYEFITLDSRL